jgi:hypothetical protein
LDNNYLQKYGLEYLKKKTLLDNNSGTAYLSKNKIVAQHHQKTANLTLQYNF